MSNDFSIEITKNFDFGTETKKMASEIWQRAEIAGAQIEASAKEKAPVGSGNLKNSIKHEVVSGDGFNFTARVYSDVQSSNGYNYAAAVENGTDPHWLPWSDQGWQTWAISKGIPPGALQHAIAMRGTQPHPFMGPAMEEVLNNFDWSL